ncbi:YihY/virulence factor BrkB family protein [Nocardioides sp.]|uniref:YihY/virulence factor BrkB family protein n=1 Tax=Nocardioides sp. TaxID=35761 RepID=UPI002ED4AB52
MSSPRERLTEIRARRPFVDHVVRMVQHYNLVKGNLQAGAITYFGFLSFFPILALAFFVVGYVSKVFPEAQDILVDALEGLFSGVELDLSAFESGAAVAGVIGVVGLLYAGLGWLSAMREALIVMFELPQREQPNFVIGKLRDLVTLALIGLTLMVSVAFTGLVSGFAKDLLAWAGLSEELQPLVTLLTVVLGLAANVVLFFTMFTLLAKPHTPRRSLLWGAVLGAIGFEALKRLSFVLLAATRQSEAFQMFGIALILLVWIYYFSRVVMYAAAWAHTSRDARDQRDREALQADRREYAMKELTHVELRETPARSSRVSPQAAFAAGGAAMLGLVALVRRRK